MLERIQLRSTNKIKGLDHLSYEEKLRAGTVQPGKEKAQGGFYQCIQVPEGREQRGQSQAFSSVVFSDRPRGNGHIMKHRRFPLNIRKLFFTVRVTKHLHRLSGKVVESPSLEIFKSHLDTVLGNQLYVPLLEQGVLDQMTSRGPFPPQPFCDSVKITGQTNLVRMPRQPLGYHLI